MYISKLTFYILLLILSFLSVKCEHCDDEDYKRKEQGNLIVKHADTLNPKTP